MQDWTRYKVLINQAVTLIITALVTGGVLAISPEQSAEMATALAGGIFIILEIVQAILTTKQVTPVDDPRDVDGAPLVRQGGAAPLRMKNR